MIVDPLNHNFLSLNTQKNHLNTNLPPNKTYYFLFNLLINAFVMYLSGRKFSPSAKNGARDQLTIIVIIFRRSVSFIFCLQWVLNCFPCRWNRRQRWKKNMFFRVEGFVRKWMLNEVCIQNCHKEKKGFSKIITWLLIQQ